MAAETLSGRAAIVHDLALEDYGFGGDHPFKPLRLRLTLELCEALGLLEGYPFLSSEPATSEDLTTVHNLTYVRMVQEAGRDAAALSDLLPYGLGRRTTRSSPTCTRLAPASSAGCSPPAGW